MGELSSRFVPSGKYYLPEEAAKRRNVDRNITGCFQSRGYREVIPPTLVNAETGLDDVDRPLRQRGLRMVGRNGDLLALRTDFTMPVAALAAAYLIPKEMPLRLYYTGSVFRTSPDYVEVDEFCQAGIELIGQSGPSADAEVITLAVEALIAVGLRDFQIGVGCAGLLQGLLDAAGARDGQREAVTLALSERNYVDYMSIVNRSDWPARSKEALLSLPSLHGGVDLLNALSPTVLGAKGSLAVDSLRAVLLEIEKSGLRQWVYVDPGMTRPFGYYTGIVFEGFVPGTGRSVAGGGRYDRLFSSFGMDVPATGFAVSVDRVTLALEPEGRLI